MEGWLRKKGQHVNLWRERYFILREEAGETRLLYFRKESDLVSTLVPSPVLTSTHCLALIVDCRSFPTL
jgi:hypothetical protein